MPRPEANPQCDLVEASATQMLLEVINDANRIFAGRHNWLSPLTNDEERKQFISRCCEWWNDVVCPAMDRAGAVWDEGRQRFEIPRNAAPLK